MSDLSAYKAKSGRFEPVWTIEIQTLPEDTDRILDAVMQVHPLSFGRYQRNASISALGKETSQPEEHSTTTTHIENFQAGMTETYPMVELKISIERDLKELEKVMDAIIYAHHYEEPVIFLREDWASRAAYNPKSDNPNRWWNNGRGMPKKLEDAEV
ncbi:hypothetical protein PsAD2_02046 [Pseudovibrio axinellae]|uniref:Uncharacterized protein n=1 Tax=Pseudovibrio axinellae TaxID=989403 RepID=A0A165YWF2_9HYPH|nr:hypothetical protein [Pseudovibrio axinellae]KZL19295.1 hypothetical protein PsAD2_02046 [Pseudovibrio axinellae]SEQ42474.1 hypothetical protein SAMN05421798_102661 [Pseudovibrio axinellae]